MQSCEGYPQQTLNGQWKFDRVKDLRKRPVDFYRTSFDVSYSGRGPEKNNIIRVNWKSVTGFTFTWICSRRVQVESTAG